MRFRHVALILFAVTSATCLSQVPSTAPAPVPPKFTVSKETTFVDGPLNADGTVNYLEAMNRIISAGVTRENNAAIPLLQAYQRPDLPFNQKVLLSLNIPPAKDGELASSLDDFVSKSKNPPTADQVSELDKATRSRPWNKDAYPLVAAWLESNKKGLSLIEEACKRDRFYLPYISDDNPPTMRDALPPLSFLRAACQLLTARAMYRSGNGDIAGAIEDLGRVRKLATLPLQQHLAITRLVGTAIDLYAMQAFVGLVQYGNLTKTDLNAARKMIDALPAYPGCDDAESQHEHLYALDSVMQLMRGHGEEFLRSNAGGFFTDLVVDKGDIATTNWDAALKEMNKVATQWNVTSKMALADKLATCDRIILEEKAEKRPVFALFAETGELAGKDATEAFLKRRETETIESYSERLGRWFEGMSGTLSKRVFLITARCDVQRDMCLLVVQLATFHIDHGRYPDALRELGTPVPQDSLSGKEMRYRREGNGYTLWCVGLNQKDEDASGDDMVIKVTENP